MSHRKKLIEVALPLEAINVASAREKSIRHGHPSTLHLWWARRPLAAARAVIFTSLVDDPDDPNALPAFVEACQRLDGSGKNVKANGDTPRMRLFDFIERLVTWEATTNEEILNTARELIQIATEGNPPPLLDPFAGGGSIPLEAQRLGLEAHASDLNPVAVMINKAQIEIPPRFANMPPVNPRDRQRMSSGEGWKGAAGLAADVRYYGEWMREKAWERIGHLYPTHNGETVIAWLWARTVQSPNPAVNAHVPLVRSFILSKKKGRECWAKPIVEGKSVYFEVTKGIPPKDKDGTYDRNGGVCVISGVPISREYLYQEGQAGRFGTQLIAIVTDGESGRSYYSPTVEHEHSAVAAQPRWEPDAELVYNARHMSPPLYGMTRFADLFTSRQLLTLTTFSDLMADVYGQICDDAINAGLESDTLFLRDGGNAASAYAECLTIYLSFAVDKIADRNSSITQWANNREHAKNTFVRQALSMAWDFAESNPFSNSSGNFLGGIESIEKILVNFTSKIFGIANQQDATEPFAHMTNTVIDVVGELI
jgi:putative DNA methylase